MQKPKPGGQLIAGLSTPGSFGVMAFAKRSQRTQSLSVHLASEMTTFRTEAEVPSAARSVSTGVCWPDRVTGSLCAVFVEVTERTSPGQSKQKRHPFGARTWQAEQVLAFSSHLLCSFVNLNGSAEKWGPCHLKAVKQRGGDCKECDGRGF